MTTWSVLASGPSMSQAVADQARRIGPVVAVSNTWQLAPWADALASADRAWWDAHPEALAFEGLKVGAMPSWQRIPSVTRYPAPNGCNSGLLGVLVAHSLGATRILLCGFDMHGEHFFGQHPEPLTNPGEPQFLRFIRQFRRYAPRDVEIANCTPGSAMALYPFSTLEDEACIACA